MIYIIVRSTHDIYQSHSPNVISFTMPAFDKNHIYPLTVYVGKNVIDVYRFTPGYGDVPCNFHAVINIISDDEIDFRVFAKLMHFFTWFIYSAIPSLPEHGYGIYDKFYRLIWFYAIYRFNNVNELVEFVNKVEELLNVEYEYDIDFDKIAKLYAKHLIFLINVTIPQRTYLPFKYFINGKLINNDFGFENFYKMFLSEFFSENYEIVKAVKYACTKNKIIYKQF